MTQGQYRRNVCAVLTGDGREQVLVFRRVDATDSDYQWQFPQGGLKAREAPETGLRRELREEIGTDRVAVECALPEPIVYRYPPDVLAALRDADPHKARYAGQAQYWFLARLLVDTERIRFEHQPAEFDAYRWVTPAEAVRLVVPFKREAYRRALTALGLL